MSFYRVPGGQARPHFQAQCTHLTMTRLYGVNFICESCHRPGPFGWVYRCTQDREELIEDAISQGYNTSLDKLGQKLAEGVKIRKRSPAACQDRFSFFQEVTPAQMSQYSPEQIATILKQREDLKFVIERETIRNNGAAILDRLRQATSIHGFALEFNHKKPWVCDASTECQYKICPYCRPGAADRAYLSLDGVANGEIPPTAAVGFGFQTLGERPVVNVDTVRDIGLRSESVLQHEYDFGDSESSYSSEQNIITRNDQQIIRLEKVNVSHGELKHITKVKDPCEATRGRLKYSPKSDNLAAFEKSRQSKSGEAFRQSADNASGPSTPNGAKQLHGTDRNPQTPRLSAHGPSLGLEMLVDQTASGAIGDAPRDTSQGTSPVSPMMEHEKDIGKFTPAPLKVDHGVAVLEESMELGVPDVITQT